MRKPIGINRDTLYKKPLFWFSILLFSSMYGHFTAYHPLSKHHLILIGLLLFLYIYRTNMANGLIVFFVLATIGNKLEIDLPGVPPLRTAHIMILMLVFIWLLRYKSNISETLRSYFSTAKNRFFLYLFGWITLSMIMGRVGGITKAGYEYQINAWLSIALAILLTILVSNYVEKIFVNKYIKSAILLYTLLNLILIGTGVYQGISLGHWKIYYYRFTLNNGIILGTSLFYLYILYKEECMNRVLIYISLLASVAVYGLTILSGSRTQLLTLILTFGFILWFFKRKMFKIYLLLLIIVFSLFFAANPNMINNLLSENMEYEINADKVVWGAGSRIPVALDAIYIIAKYPLWGTGTDFYRRHSSIFLLGLEEGKIIGGSSAHNTWLQASVDHGIPAAILLAVFLFFLCRDVMHIYNKTKEDLYKKFTLVFLAGLCTTIILSFFGESILPVFTASYGGEAAQLAPYLINFWLPYGIFLGIEKIVNKN